MSDWRDQPATEKQLARLRWWASKLERHAPLLNPCTKGQAHDLIDAWNERYPKIRELYEAHREEREDFLEQIRIIESDVDDWREFYGCQKIPRAIYDGVASEIGGRKRGEKIDSFMDRFFEELFRREPQLFPGGLKSKGQPRATRVGGLVAKAMLLAIILLILLVFIVAAIWGMNY